MRCHGNNYLLLLLLNLHPTTPTHQILILLLLTLKIGREILCHVVIIILVNDHELVVFFAQLFGIRVDFYYVIEGGEGLEGAEFYGL